MKKKLGSISLGRTYVSEARCVKPLPLTTSTSIPYLFCSCGPCMQPFPWRDSDKTLLHNPRLNPGPEPEEEKSLVDNKASNGTAVRVMSVNQNQKNYLVASSFLSRLPGWQSSGLSGCLRTQKRESAGEMLTFFSSNRNASDSILTEKKAWDWVPSLNRGIKDTVIVDIPQPVLFSAWQGPVGSRSLSSPWMWCLRLRAFQRKHEETVFTIPLRHAHLVLQYVANIWVILYS